jgi:hypothetical protein
VQRSRKGDPDQVRREQHKGDIWREQGNDDHR